MRTLMVLLLLLVTGIAPAQTLVKCTQADGSIAYQQTACAGGAQERVDVYAPPPPTPAPQERRMVQAFDPATGVPHEAWVDGPAPPNGAFYITREFQTVVDPQTGIQRQELVDVRNPVPTAPRTYSTPPPKPRSRYNDGDTTTYQKAKCRVANC